MAESSERTAKRRGKGRPFQPGQSGNPGGRPREESHVRELARQRTEEAIATLTAIMQSGETESARVRAAEALLDRGWGRPLQGVEVADVTAEPLEIIVRYVDQGSRAGAG